MGKNVKKNAGKPLFYCASVSWGAGSLYMLLRLLETPEQKLNMVIFVNMGREFGAVLRMRDQMLPVLRDRGILYKEIDVSEQFEYDMQKRPVRCKERGEIHRTGYGWCGGPCRWGTGLKLDTLYRYYRKELSMFRIVEYVGLCADEEERQYRNNRRVTLKRYPLIEWGISKRQAVMGCYERGFFWQEPANDSGIQGYYLYELLDNVSCYHCRNKNLKELKNMYYCLPAYWEELKRLQKQ